MCWLREDPDASAVTLLCRLQSAHPGRYSRAHLLTLQRRVQQWRGIMANKLVYAASEATLSSPAECRKWSYLGATPRADFSVTFLDEATGFGKNS